ncbi:GL17905 [Drosophila persimilis]|uniref:GL17905 n=1 Tax=Drosophila persimilis TaxID=7234 RepID=B4H1T7_DROPE|nr:GL17905 [Drosophila persimilis]
MRKREEHERVDDDGTGLGHSYERFRSQLGSPIQSQSRPRVNQPSESDSDSEFELELELESQSMHSP